MSHPCKATEHKKMLKHRLLEKKLTIPMCGKPCCSAWPLWEMGTKCRAQVGSQSSSGFSQFSLAAKLRLHTPSRFAARLCLDRVRARANIEVNTVGKTSPGNIFNKRLVGRG